MTAWARRGLGSVDLLQKRFAATANEFERAHANTAAARRHAARRASANLIEEADPVGVLEALAELNEVLPAGA